jgi:hypothetical protein
VLILPFAFFSHIAIWSFAGLTGGRFSKPTDWFMLVFYCIGLVEVSVLLILYITGKKNEIGALTNKRDVEEIQSSKITNNWPIFFASGFFVILGLAPFMFEIILPDRSADYSIETYFDQIEELDQPKDSTLLTCYMDEINSSPATVLSGKALYPRYFERGEALEDDRSRTVPDSTNRRIDFYLIGGRDTWVSLPLIVSQVPFPHFSDVIIEGNFVRGTDQDLMNGYKPYFLANTVYVIDQSDMIIKISPAGPGCDE